METQRPPAHDCRFIQAYIGMLIIGALNNFPYWVAISSAQAIVTNFNSEGLLGLITWGCVLFGVFATTTNTFLSSKNVSYTIRAIINGCFMTFGLIGTALSPNIYLAIICIAFVGLSSDFGEGVMLGYFASTANDSLMNAWGIGTGISGCLGSGYSFLCQMFSVPYVTSFLALSPAGIFYPLAFIFLLKPQTNTHNAEEEHELGEIQESSETTHDIEHPNENTNEFHDPTADESIVDPSKENVEIAKDGNPVIAEPEQSDHHKPEIHLHDNENAKVEEDIKCCSLRIWKKAIYFFLINGGTFFAQYASISCFADCSMTQQEKIDKPYWYSLLNLCYQIGNAAGRSTLQCFKIRQIWLLMIIQFCLFALWWVNVVYRIIPEWLQVIIMLVVGVNSGFSYVNIFNQTMNYPAASQKEREIITNYTSISIAGFIVVSSAFTLLMQNTVLEYECLQR